MKQLAKLTLEYPKILEDIKGIAQQLKISYDSAKHLKARYLARSNGSFLCPECLCKLGWRDGGLVCIHCGYFKQIALPTISYDNTSITALYELGTYQPKYGEWRGYERFLWECLDEVKEVLKGYALSPRVLDRVGKLIRKYAKLFYEGRSDKLSRYKVILQSLSEASVEDPVLKEASLYYFHHGPLQLKRRSNRTKGTKPILKVV
jgi:hypothetical protein